MKSLAKKMLIVAVAAVCAAALCFGACSASKDDPNNEPAFDDNGETTDPVDTGTTPDQDDTGFVTDLGNTGADGTDSGNGTDTDAAASSGSGTVISNTVVNNYYTMTDEQFQQYLNSISSNGSGGSSAIEAASARSVFSSVSVLSFLNYRSTSSSGYGFNRRQTYVFSDNAYAGSGVIVDLDKDSGDAYVLTNCHVVYDDTAVTPVSDRVYLYLYGQDIEDKNYSITTVSTTYTYEGTDYSYTKCVTTGDDDYCIEATVVAASVQYDLALLKVSGSEVLKNSSAIAAAFAEDDEVYAGQSVYIVGNPLGDGTTVTTGVVSQESVENNLYVNSTTSTLYREIKTDAAVNEGNSGGAMYNSSGEIIGIIHSKMESTSVDNNAFALAGSYVKRVYELMKDSSDGTQITDAGISRAYLEGGYSVDASTYYGYTTQNAISTGYEITYSYAYLDETGSVPRARVIDEVAVTTTSYGLEVGDIITHLTITDTEGNKVEDLDITRKFLLDDALISYRNGYTVTLTYSRNGETGTANVSCEWVSQM
ncbi:MAG: S1C family serine protease [Clostridia bacterium]|nr:S1C family serine protease [Clostridia bacterium]